MNRIHRKVWSSRLGAYVAVAETARCRGKASAGVCGALLASVLLSPIVQAQTAGAGVLPAGGQVTAGQATISTSGSTMTVQQNSQRTAINWGSFNIGSGAMVNFQQPNASAVALNRVVGSEPSLIDGTLIANGNVYLLNANGVLFNRSAQVNVNGLVASTLNISDADFMAGKTTFESNGSRSSIINLGQLTAASAGHIALLGQHVANEGVIHATLGSAILAAGDKVTLNLNGDSLVGVTVDRGILNALVENKKAIVADGGLVTLTAKGLDEVMRTVVNNTGEIRAQTIDKQTGRIYLLGGMAHDRIEVGGTLNANAPHGGDGGFVETSAAHVQLQAGHHVSTMASQGATGTWLIDPNDYTVAASGGNITGTQLGIDLGSNNITISTAQSGTAGGHGDIFLNDNVTWSSGRTLTLSAERNIKINATLDASAGSGGVVHLFYGQGAVALGNTASYDFGLNSSGFTGNIKLQAGQNFSTKLGSNGTAVNYEVITQLGVQSDIGGTFATGGYTLQGIRTNLTGNYVLGADIDAGATSSWGSTTVSGITYNGFVPLSIGYTDSTNNAFSTANTFKGSFVGLGHTIRNLSIDLTSNTVQLKNNAALFGATGNAVTYIGHVALVDSTIKGGLVGGVVGYAYALSTIDNVFIGNGVTLQGTERSGGIIGVITGAGGASTLKNSYSFANLTSTGDRVGGLVGDSWASVISNSTSGGTINGHDTVGGAIGWTNGGSAVSYVNSSASVIGNGTNNGTGGLIGGASAGNTISNSSATGSVTGLSYVGGFIGRLSGAASLYDSFATGGVTGNNTVGGFAGAVVGASGATVQRSYSTGNVGATGLSPQRIGGFVGYNSGTIQQSYSTGNVSASTASAVGGFVGYGYINQWEGPGLIQNSYATGNVTGGSYVGGFAGQNAAAVTIENSYAAGGVSGTSSVAGFIGINASGAYLTNSYWDSQTTGQSSGWGSGSDTTHITGVSAKTSAEMKSLNTFSAWGSAIVLDTSLAGNYPQLRWTTSGLSGTSVWVIGATPVAYTLSMPSGSYDYNGNPYSLSSIWSASAIFGSSHSGWTAGTDYSFQYNGQTVTSFTNAASYGGITVNVLASGYITASSGNTAGTLTIHPKTLSLSASKTYDGTPALSAAQVTFSGLVGSETLSYTSGTANSKNVGAGNYISAITLLDGTGLASNYQLPTLNAANAPVNISAKAITISGLSSQAKTYDGTRVAAVNGTAAFASETAGSGSSSDGKAYTGDALSLTGTAVGTFNSKDVASASSVAFTGLSLTGGDAGNYALSQHADATGVHISAKAITISGTTVADKTYDGSRVARTTPGTLSGMVGNEFVSATGVGTFDAAAPGRQGAIVTYILHDDRNGGLASNYSLADTAGLAATILPGEPLVNTSGAAAQPSLLAPESGQLGGKTNDALLPASYQVNVVARLSSAGAQQTPGNVVALPPSMPVAFGQPADLAVLSSPSAGEASAAVTLGQARMMMSGGSSDGTREVRVPVSRNSMAEIVNGGVKLPDAVEQELFVVKK